MNEEESTFFVTIEKSNMKIQNINFKNMKSKYFCLPIKSKRRKRPDINNNNHSPSFPNNDHTNSITKINNIPSKINKINNISINNIQSYMQNDNKSKNFILENDKDNNNNKIQNNNDDLEENIDIDDDIDEYSDVKFNININKPKLPFNSKNYYNNINKNKLSYSVSRNIINNCFNKTLINKSEILKNNDYDICKNKSCTFINNDLLKLRLHQNISIAESKIDMRKTLIKRRNLQILSLQLLLEKINTQREFKKNDKNFEKKVDEMNKHIFNLKLKLSKCKEKYINKKILEKEINNEKMLYSIKKAQIIEKILELRTYIINKSKNNDYNSNIINNNIEESTINNESIFLESEYNILETKENVNLTEINTNKINNKCTFKDKDNDNKNINNNVINCFKNIKFSGYFAQRFIIETKNNNKNNNNKIQKTNNSKFNIFIDIKKEK